MGRKITFLAFGVMGGMILRSWWISNRVAKDIRRMEPDSEGNYDIDGVSFDKKEHTVVVSGDLIREAGAG